MWTKEFQESESHHHHYQSEKDQSSDRQQQAGPDTDWQHSDNAKQRHAWQHFFKSDFAGDNHSSRSKQQHRQDVGRKVYQVQQQHCMQILGLSPTAALDSNMVRTAFLESAKRWHPDRHADDAKSDAESKFKEAQTAYQHLLTCV